MDLVLVISLQCLVNAIMKRRFAHQPTTTHHSWPYAFSLHWKSQILAWQWTFILEIICGSPLHLLEGRHWATFLFPFPTCISCLSRLEKLNLFWVFLLHFSLLYTFVWLQSQILLYRFFWSVWDPWKAKIFAFIFVFYIFWFCMRRWCHDSWLVLPNIIFQTCSTIYIKLL